MTTRHRPALKIDHLTVNYGTNSVLKNISLEVPTGKIVGIIGPNCAGKSTLIKAALGLVKPIAGKIEFDGGSLDEMRGKIAYVPQRETVDWDFPITVRDLVLMGRYGALGICRRPRKEDREAVDKCLEQTGMLPYANRQISQLSGGQQQRAFLARALVQAADIYFMDEPFAGVDMGTEAVIMQILRELSSQNKTVFVVHHDLSSVVGYFDWLIVLNTNLIGYGDVKDIFHSAALAKAYGKNYALFDEAIKLSKGT